MKVRSINPISLRIQRSLSYKSTSMSAILNWRRNSQRFVPMLIRVWCHWARWGTLVWRVQRKLLVTSKPKIRKQESWTWIVRRFHGTSWSRFHLRSCKASTHNNLNLRTLSIILMMMKIGCSCRNSILAAKHLNSLSITNILKIMVRLSNQFDQHRSTCKTIHVRNLS
jgi:hypothetical protein